MHQDMPELIIDCVNNVLAVECTCNTCVFSNGPKHFQISSSFFLTRSAYRTSDRSRLRKQHTHLYVAELLQGGLGRLFRHCSGQKRHSSSLTLQHSMRTLLVNWAHDVMTGVTRLCVGDSGCELQYADTAGLKNCMSIVNLLQNIHGA